MWQYIITGIILIAAAAFVIHRILKTLRGRDTFACAFCTDTSCPGRQEQDEEQGVPGEPPADEEEATGPRQKARGPEEPRT